MNGVPADSVPSPCRDVCQLDARGICIGCGRSLNEIAEWSRAGGERRLQIRAAAHARLPASSETPQGGELLDPNPR